MSEDDKMGCDHGIAPPASAPETSIAGLKGIAKGATGKLSSADFVAQDRDASDPKTSERCCRCNCACVNCQCCDAHKPKPETSERCACGHGMPGHLSDGRGACLCYGCDEGKREMRQRLDGWYCKGFVSAPPPATAGALTRAHSFVHLDRDVMMARAEISRLCRSGTAHGSEQWRMTIPVDEYRDSDRILSRALDHIAALRARAEALNVALHGAAMKLDAAEQERARLERIIEEAPHGPLCGFPNADVITIDKLPRRNATFHAERGPCDCWKKAATPAPAKGEQP